MVVIPLTQCGIITDNAKRLHYYRHYPYAQKYIVI